MTILEALKLAFAHYQAGRFDPAAEVCRAILAVAPQQVETIHLLGVIFFAAGQLEEGERNFTATVALKPEMADAYTNLGVLRQRQGRLAEAVAFQTRTLTLQPTLVAALLNRGSAWLAQGNRTAATEDFARAAALNPGDPGPLNSLGSALREQGKVRAAVAAHTRAIALKPDFTDAYRDLGHVLREAEALPMAAAAYARAFRLDPARTETLSYYLFVKQAICDWTGYEDNNRRLGDIIDHDRGIVLPLANLSIDTTAAQQKQAARYFYRTLIDSSVTEELRPAPPAGPGQAGGRLNIAYFSADFYEHATAYLAAELFELHDRNHFRITAYSYGNDDGSPMRRRLIEAFDTFHDVRNVGIEQIRTMLAADGIDILVELKGYTKQSRLELLGRRLAPVQVAYLGYPGTTACPFMDYVIGDRFVTPLENQPFFSERLVVMPDSYQINDRRRPPGLPVPARAACGLPETGFVFCAFNTTYKITPGIFAVWMRLLAQVPGSVLWLFEANSTVTENLRREVAARGIDPTRLVFAPKRPLAEHLARYRLADLCVDTFPYTGHTTTSDALWVGQPVVTCMGDTFASRVAAGLLSAAGLPETITRSFAEYEALALRLAAEPGLLASYRARLEANRLRAPLFDSRRFTRHLESAYERMWQRHVAGLPPTAFAVEPLPAGTIA